MEYYFILINIIILVHCNSIYANFTRINTLLSNLDSLVITSSYSFSIG